MALIPQSPLPPYKLLILKLKPQSLHLTLCSSIPRHKRDVVSGQFAQPLEITESSNPPPANSTPLSGDDGYFLELHNFPMNNKYQKALPPRTIPQPGVRVTEKSDVRWRRPVSIIHYIILRKFETNVAFILMKHNISFKIVKRLHSL